MIQPGPGRNIVWLASYPRSGNTWVRFLLHNLIEISQGRTGGNINDINQYSDWEAGRKNFEDILGKDFDPKDYKSIFAARPKAQARLSRKLGEGTALLKTHLGIMSMGTVPTINAMITAGAVYIVRNPLDVVPSLAAHLDLSIDGAIDFMANPRAHLYVPEISDQSIVFEPMGSWSAHVEGWTNSESSTLLTLRYEDLIADPVAAFGRIASHLKFVASDEQLAEAVELSSFERASAQEAEVGYQVERTRKSSRFFRAGRAGDFASVLSAEQIERVAAAHGPVMERFGYLPVEQAE